jgi:hypothetical protein
LYEEQSEENDKRAVHKGGIIIPYRFGKRDYEIDDDSDEELDKRMQEKVNTGKVGFVLPYRFGKRENPKKVANPLPYLRFGKRKEFDASSEYDLFDYLKSEDRDKRRMSHRLMPFRYG